MIVPEVLFNSVSTTIGRHEARDWAAALDFMLADLMRRWQVTRDPVPGTPWAGAESIVFPVLTRENYQAVIRIAAPNHQNPRVHEQVLMALQAWGGHGAVRVIYQDSSFRATLQERLRTKHNLSSEPLARVPAIWGQLSRALKVPAAEGFVRVQDIARGWLASFDSDAALTAGFPDFTPADRRLLDIARGWIEHLARSNETWLLHADLHYYNILAGHPDASGVATWKAIDPQPLSGPTAYTVAPVLWNRLSEIPGAGAEDQAAWLRDFAVSLCTAADIDPSFGTGASIAREVENMFWYLRTAHAGTPSAFGDAARSLWVARALAGLPVGTPAGSLKRLG